MAVRNPSNDRRKRSRDTSVAVSRRSVIRTAGLVAAGITLSGCSSVLTAAVRSIAPPRLRIGLVGLPDSVGAAMGHALDQTAPAFTKRMGPVMLEVTTQTLPELACYQCATGAACGPASAVEASAVFKMGPSAPNPQLLLSSGGIFVTGRTSLGIRFGGNPSQATPASRSDLRHSGPDIILAYSLWQYWLAPLATPLLGFARTYASELSGIPQNVFQHGQFFSQSDGYAPLAVPILRNPMAIFILPQLATQARAANPRWTWEGLAQWHHATAASIDTGGFLWLSSYPEGTETAMALVASYGGSVGIVHGDRVLAAFRGTEAQSGLRKWSQIIDGGLPFASEGNPPRGMVEIGPHSYVVPQHLWSPLWGNRYHWNPTWTAFPMPAGPSGRQVPCTYLCGFVTLGNTTKQLAEEYLAFLLSKDGQSALSSVPVGLPLRKEDAIVAAEEQYPWIKDAATFAESSTDLSLSMLFGDVEHIKTDKDINAVSDDFARTLADIQKPLIGSLPT